MFKVPESMKLNSVWMLTDELLGTNFCVDDHGIPKPSAVMVVSLACHGRFGPS